MDEMESAEKEQALLLALGSWEDIIEKKVKIYSRLLTDPALAKTMEEIGFRLEKRKEELLSLACGKPPKKKNEQGRCATNGEEG